MKFTFNPESTPLEGYTIKRAIHRGGFGEVYYALTDAGKEVALKLLNNNLEVELRGVRQCLNLKHPNLVTIFDIREDRDKDHWIVMEYVAGRGLFEVLKDHPNGMPLPDVLHWLNGMTAGLSFLHDRGIVHRDLKPANVFSDQGVVKIGDVGLSKYISESRRSAQTQSVGTVYYMAPEVARGRYGREVDVYAMGIMLFEMVTGTVPFDGQTTAEILMKHLTADPDLAGLPDPLRPVIADALQKDPAKRIADVDELERRFRQAAARVDSSVSAEPVVRKPTIASEAAAAAAAIPRSGQRQRKGAHGSRPTAGLKGQLTQIWNALPAPARWIVAGALTLLLLNSRLIEPITMGGLLGGAAYLGYRGFRKLTGNKDEVDSGAELTTMESMAPAAPPPPARSGPRVTAAAPAAAAGRSRRFRSKRSAVAADLPEYTPATLRRIRRSHRVADLSTSLSLTAIAAGLVTLAVAMTTNLLPSPVVAVYFGIVTLVASWALIIPSKWWEGRAGDGFLRRLMLASAGVGVGLIAWKLQSVLLLDASQLRIFGGRHPHTLGPLQISDGSGTPTPAVLACFFAILFAARRWWWQADSFRKSRFRISSSLLTLLVGSVASGILSDYAFPYALGATWSLAVSAVVQLSSGWTPPEQRVLKDNGEVVNFLAETNILPEFASTEVGMTT